MQTTTASKPFLLIKKTHPLTTQAGKNRSNPTTLTTHAHFFDAAAKGGQFLTGQHEAFHGFLWGVARKHLENVKKWELGGMKGDKPVSPIAQMGNSVLNYLTTTEGVEFFNVKTKRWNNNPRFSELNLRFKQYLADAARGKLDDKTVLEEVLPLLSEALTKGMIKKS